MQLNSPILFAQFHSLLQGHLFPILESAIGPLSKPGQLLASVISLLPLAAALPPDYSTGRPPADRQALFVAFLAKAVYNLITTRQLLDRLHHDPQLYRLCGWKTRSEIPSEATFSRAFAEFAAANLPHVLHQTLVKITLAGRHFDYIARDSTAIEVRERIPQDRNPAHPANAKKKDIANKKGNANKKGKRRPGGAHPRAKACERGSRLKRQQHMTLDQMIDDLPMECSIGVKTSSKGHKQYWRGYKLHFDVVSEARVPVSCLLTGANVHDSQVAIPLIEMSAANVRWGCDVMDAAYDAKAIREHCGKRGHQTLIQAVQRWLNKGKKLEFTEEEKERYKVRTIVEQMNGRLKDEFGGRIIYVRGAVKVLAHLMYGMIALTVDQLLRTVT